MKVCLFIYKICRLYPVDNTRIDAGGSVEYEAEESDKKTK